MEQGYIRYNDEYQTMMDTLTAPLYAATEQVQEAVVRKLISDRGVGADVNNTSSNGKTPLMVAAENGLEAVVRLLLEAGAYVNKWDYDCYMPLGGANDLGHEAIALALLEAGADVL